MQFRRWLLISTLALVALSPAGCSRSPQASERRAPAPASWTLDEAHDYELSLHSGYGSAQESLFKLDLTATLQLTAIRRDGRAVEFLAQLREPKLIVQQSGHEPESMDKLRAEFEQPHVFTLVDGRFTQSRMRPGANPLVQGVMRTLSSAFQRVEDTSKAQTKPREVRETDATGDYVSAYERVEANTLRKRKLRYESWSSAAAVGLNLGAQVQVPRVVRSQTDVRGTAAAPERVSIDEVLETDLGRTTALQSATKLTLLRRGSQPSAALAASARQELYAGSVELAANAPLPAASPIPPAALDAVKLAGLSFPDILHGLEAEAERRANAKPDAPATPAQAQGERANLEQVKLFSALNASLRQAPAHVSEIERAIRKGSAARETLISGLGASGAQEGQELLLKLMADKSLPEQVRNACGLSLARTPRPSAAAVRGLESHLDDPDFHRLAVYGLGTYARLLRQAGDEAGSKQLLATMMARLETAKTNQERVDWILGISNSGAPEILGLVRAGLLIDPSADIRNAAVTSLRLLDDRNAEQLIVKTLALDRDRHVRLAAVRALRGRAPSSTVVSALERACLKDESDRVRYESVRLIGRILPQAPTLRAALQQVASVDPQELIRSFAAATLDGAAPPADPAEES